MTDLRTVESVPSPLVRLPPELQLNVFENLSRHHLNRLSQTCKALHAAVLPRLYTRVIICVPQRWSRLESLESLISSNGDGLKHTTELVITVQQDPLRDSQQGSEDNRTQAELLEERNLQFGLPQNSASNALNAFIRLLIVKLPRDKLDAFTWEHGCELDVSTANLLFERQKNSLVEFSCNRYCSSCDISGSVIHGLVDLSIESMNFDKCGSLWAARLLVENAMTLDHLNLGYTTRIAYDYAHDRPSRHDKMSTLFATNVKKVLSDYSDSEPLLHLSLQSLYLSGLDLGSVIQGEMALDIDFNKIVELRLESCSGLNEALYLFTDKADSPKLALGALRDLYLRLDGPDADLINSLDCFLESVRGLTDLQVLIDKTSNVHMIESILKIHGRTLTTLVWEERRGRRTQLDDCTSIFPGKLGNLSAISQHCPFLKVLGIPLDWEAISASDKYHETIGRYLRRMPNLEVLSIRNLPELKGGISTLLMDYFVQSVAAMFVNVVNKKRKSASFEFIALGAPLHRDVNIGTHHVAHTPVSDLVRFRVYKVDYKHPSPSGLSIVLSEVVNGAALSAEETFPHEHLLEDYWLG